MARDSGTVSSYRMRMLLLSHMEGLLQVCTCKHVGGTVSSSLCYMYSNNITALVNILRGSSNMKCMFNCAHCAGLHLHTYRTVNGCSSVESLAISHRFPQLFLVSSLMLVMR